MATNDIVSERSHFLIVPSDPAQRVIIEKVEKACRASLLGTYKVRLNPGYTSTIACVYVEALVRTLVQCMRENKGDAQINFLDLFTIVSDNRENDDADKDGNINIRYVPGQVLEGIMERDFHPDVMPEMWKDSILMHVQKECAHILSTKHRFTTNDANHYTCIAYCYLVFLFRTLKMMAKLAHEQGQTSVMINFLEMFECHCTVTEVQNPENEELVHQEFKVKILPGFQSKLLIKDDNVTEFDEDDE